MDDFKYLIRGGVVVVLFVVLWMLAPFATVPANSTGVMTTFGDASETVYGPGIHFRLPIAQTMNIVHVAISAKSVKTDAASKDLQSVSTEIVINYHIEATKSVYVYKELNNDPYAIIVEPAVHEALKAVTAQYTAEELISKRQEVRTAIISNLKDRLERHGISIDEFSIVDFQFSKSFNEAIEAKTTAEQLKLKADMDLKRISVEAQQTVVKAQAQADSLKAQKQEITPELIELRKVENEKAAIEKWDGHMPTYSGGAMPFVQVQK